MLAVVKSLDWRGHRRQEQQQQQWSSSLLSWSSFDWVAIARNRQWRRRRRQK